MTAAESARPALEGVGAGRVVAAAPMGSVSSGRVRERVAVPWVRQTCRASRVEEESGLFLVKKNSGSIHIHSFICLFHASIQSSIHSSIHASIHASIHSSIHATFYSFTHSLIHLFVRSSIYICLFIHSFCFCVYCCE